MKKLGVYFVVALLVLSLIPIRVFADGDVTWNPFDKHSSYTLSDNNLTAEKIGNYHYGIRATKGRTTGKWYWEIEVISRKSNGRIAIGVAKETATLDASSDIFSSNHDIRVVSGDEKTYPRKAFGDSKFNNGDTIGVALDLDNRTLGFYKNGQFMGMAFQGEDKTKGLDKETTWYPYLTGWHDIKAKANFGSTEFKYNIPEGFSSYNGDTSQPNETSLLDIEPEKETIKQSETVSANLVIDNINEIVAEDIRINYDEEKLEFLGFEEVDGMKLVKSVEKTANGDLRVIVASEGEANIINAKEVLLELKFKGIETGEALVDITNGRVTDGIELEKDLAKEECGEATIVIEGLKDVNNSGEFTLLDLGIDARHFSKDPASSELDEYNTDIVVNGEIDDEDLLEIGRLILENPNYTPNN